ncbi:MAG: ANTAR domain-containing protein [Magnetospirillum sp.]|nr:ANTAR domain-containing protein [Magnetospirillum sp.]
MSLRVIVVDDERERAALVTQALTANGFQVVAVLGAGACPAHRVTELAADVIIVDIDSPDRDMLEDMRRVTFDCGRPVVMFAQDGNPETIRAAVEAGVSAYVVDGLKPERVKPVVDVAIARFRQFQELRSELGRTKATLAERKLVEKAKGILMRQRGCGEEEAYRLMRKMAMDRKVRLADIANRIIEAAQLLG